MAKAPWLLDSDTAAVRAWAIAETRAGLYADALARHQEDRAVPCAGCETCLPWDTALARWQTTAANHRIRLGLDPLSRAQLGKDVTQAALNTSRASGTVDAQIAAEIAALESELGIPSGAGRYVVNDHLSDLIDADSEEREP
ncbi:MAG TPA: hypothetical protein VGE38_16860 [Nocardioides sp.]|uniref:hypothetical protein n=1 Tax=Nocardioides sp. TaxID=35761 RepID=UPI002ED8C11C